MDLLIIQFGSKFLFYKTIEMRIWNSNYKCLDTLLQRATAPKNWTLADFDRSKRVHENVHTDFEYCKFSRILLNFYFKNIKFFEILTYILSRNIDACHFVNNWSVTQFSSYLSPQSENTVIRLRFNAIIELQAMSLVNNTKSKFFFFSNYQFMN